MLQRQWILRDIDHHQALSLGKALSISPITATVLLGRGVVGLEQARRWLSPSDLSGHDPFLLPDMERVVDRIHQAILKGERMCCYGDYDVDGISAVSLFLKFFRQFGAHVVVYIPDRHKEGYGLNEGAVRKLATDGVTVLVTADCGTTSHAEVDLAGRLGMDVIVIDHHQIQGRDLGALALVNPQRVDSQYPFPGLCSGGLAYKVAEAYTMKFGDCEVPVESFHDFVALASIADMVPLQDENRFLVHDGLIRMTEGTRCGIRALKQCVGVEGVCTASTVGFRLAPVINAAGRLAHAKAGVQLLTTESEQEALELTRELELLNKQRRDIEQGIFEEAKDLVEKAGEPSAIVVGAQGWHMGVVGIVASRLVERYHRPSVVIALDGQGVGRGSVRSVPGLDVCEVLEQCRDFLEGFGGHPAAAGLTIREDRLLEFREKFVGLVNGVTKPGMRVPVLEVDAHVSLTDIHLDLLHELNRLHPFGMGNPEPTFVVKGLRVLEKKTVGHDHLKLVVRQNGSVPFESIGFRMGSLAQTVVSTSQPIDLAFIPELNRWRGLDRVQLRIRDLKVSQ